MSYLGREACQFVVVESQFLEQREMSQLRWDMTLQTATRQIKAKDLVRRREIAVHSL
jgi:hypothetical protein